MLRKRPSVLIANDEQVICDLPYDELRDLGYPCTTVYNGNDALTELETQDFDVVLP